MAASIPLGEAMQDSAGDTLQPPIDIDFAAASTAWRANKAFDEEARVWSYVRQAGDDVFWRAAKGERWQRGVVTVPRDGEVEVEAEGQRVVLVDDRAHLRCWSTPTLYESTDGYRERAKPRRRKKRRVTGLSGAGGSGSSNLVSIPDETTTHLTLPLITHLISLELPRDCTLL